MAGNDTERQNPATERGLIDAAADMLWNHTTAQGIERLISNGEPGEMERDYKSAIGKIAQDVQEFMADLDQEEKQAAQAALLWFDYSGYDAKLCPGNPDFDIDAYSEAIAAEGGYPAIQERLKEKFANVKEDLQTTANAYSQALGTINDQLQQLGEAMHTIAAFVEAHQEEYAAIKEPANTMPGLAPFIKAELAESSGQEYSGLTLEAAIAQDLNEQGEPASEEYRQLFANARQRRDAFENQEIITGDISGTLQQVYTQPQLQRIVARAAEKLEYPLDKPNAIVWNFLEDAAQNNPNGQLKININTSKKGSKQDALIVYGIDFDNLQSVNITKRLTPFDKRCMIAAGALFNAGNNIITATQVYYEMGNTTPPNKTDIAKVNDSITKQNAGHVYYDNGQEVKTAKGYAHQVYDGSLLPMERVSAYINGQLVDSAIKLYREPPLLSFAKDRKQVTTISRKLLESPVSKTDANLRLDDYLLERIGHMKNPKSHTPRKLLFKTIYEACAITTAVQKRRAPEKICRYLDHYKSCKWIRGYKIEADGITILL